ncbi:HEAT repeat domain-containing protein [Actinomadura sp. NAK00032]|uniref:HEAT repeat domain-containing protein n=1 Tax=Actinomadura sp. NAK00032 TaxID=2742128 RepID=UPI00158FA80D|nr:HEAT repeat domain-containing protein [Actinomadura sp. NAK00032]QKW38729.1 HEAT repeat domain-containing protein [Actinomadura sp. NAK00032]
MPFLLALAADPGAPERTWPLYLATALALGFDETHLPSGVAIAEWRAETARLLATDAEAEARRLDAWVAEASDDRERRSRERARKMFDFGWAQRTATAELAAYDAVRAGLPTLRALLGDTDAGVRATAAYAVGWFPEESADSLAALSALLGTERDPAVITNALISAGLLDGRDLLHRIREHLAGTEPGPRWAAAIALARLDEADAPVIARLAASCTSPPELEADFLNGEVRLYSALSLAALDETPPDAVQAVIEGLARTSDAESFSMAEVVLRLTFGTPVRPLPPFADLTPVQRQAVRTIAELPPDSWRWTNLMEILDAWGVPTDHDDCRRYAGLA